MITKNDLAALDISPTNKDYYQVWNELLDTAKKLSERWDPTSTNESDPGIVLLKVLTAITDKLNYNIDKNILEAFMPTAAQQESMRKLCDMMGYNMRYYQSAMCDVSLIYVGSETIEESSVKIPKFTNITSLDQDINFFTTEDVYIRAAGNTVPCMEGTSIECEENNSKIITIDSLDDNFRYYLPETQIAENGIFIFNSVNGSPSNARWERKNNLNDVVLGSYVYKFGFDSKLSAPYIQFPSDISSLINDGLFIRYTRTSGLSGNISAKTLVAINMPEISYTTADEREITIKSDDFKVLNPSAAYGGNNIETITAAYEGFKRTVGTFEALITCRDYMNFIYQQLFANSSLPLVSNINVTDLRNDINRAATICEFSDYGMSFVPAAINDRMSHFDLVFYPFRSIYSKNSKDSYNGTFQYTSENLSDILAAIEDTKLISHEIQLPQAGSSTQAPDIVLIKNYARLSAVISTNAKVNSLEQLAIIENIKLALYNAFNMRELEFGEEIPFDLISNCIKSADSRIKNVSLNEPDYVTKIVINEPRQDSSALKELWIKPSEGAEEVETAYTEDSYPLTWRDYSCDLLVQNILAGRVALFNYDTAFSVNFNEHSATINKNIQKLAGTFNYVAATSTNWVNDRAKTILYDNELISFRLPNYRTKITYPAYVHYFAKLPNGAAIEADTLYKLTEGQFIYISYTSSTVNENGEESAATVINKVYTQGSIIKTNFTIKDSSTNGATYAKTTALPAKFFVEGDYNQSTEINRDFDGMYTFGPNEQLEVLERIEVKLQGQATYLYWILNDTSGGNGRTIPFNENHQYTLQEGEYLFYTDANQLDMAYYGNGTVLTNQSGLNFTLASQEKISLDSILQYGIKAVPWQNFSFNTNNYLQLQEYQYVNLGAGDYLVSAKLKDTSSGEHKNEITGIWTDVDTASVNYILGDSLEKLDDIDSAPLIPLPKTKNVDPWQVRSYLSLDFGPAKAQKLNTYSDGSEIDRNIISLYDNVSASEAIDEIKSGAIKANHSIQATADSVSTLYKDENKNTIGITTKAIFLTKATVTSLVAGEDEPVQNIPWHNFNNKWTFMSLQNVEQIDLSVSIARSDAKDTDDDDTKLSYGLLMIYLAAKDKEPGTPATGDLAITVKAQSFNSSATPGASAFSDIDEDILSFYNDPNAEDPTDTLNLHYGINIVKFINGTKKIARLVITVANGEDRTDSIIFSDYDCVLCDSASVEDTDGLNDKQLDFSSFLNESTENPRWTTLNNIAKKLLTKLSTICTSTIPVGETTTKYDRFYYNCLLTNDSALDFPIDKKLLDSQIFFNYNNMCNPFVVSEIDAEFLTYGITIANSSKLS